ncbi:MAG: hypothetical protein JWS10_4171 [Cypionkella sp.]|nr:hypothetical protein [Cypionkella sp.]
MPYRILVRVTRRIWRAKRTLLARKRLVRRAFRERLEVRNARGLLLFYNPGALKV